MKLPFLCLMAGLLTSFGVADTLPPSVTTPSGVANSPPPSVTLEDGPLKAVVYLPDSKTGFYRGSRFNWSGMIPSLSFGNHHYFTPFGIKSSYVTNHAAGPADEFDIQNPNHEEPPGYLEAQPGGVFLKIGVGWLRKPPKGLYDGCKIPYEIADPGIWTISKEDRAVTFAQHLAVNQGYGCDYEKRVSLDASKKMLVITQKLKNTGSKILHTINYCHNFIQIDDTPIGSSYRFQISPDLPQVGTSPDLQRSNAQWLFNKAVLQTASVIAFATPDGTNTGLKFLIENSATGGKLQLVVPGKIERLALYLDPSHISPEPFVKIVLQPQEETQWTWEYEFQPEAGN